MLNISSAVMRFPPSLLESWVPSSDYGAGASFRITVTKLVRRVVLPRGVRLVLALSLLLRGVCATPKRARIDTIGIEVEHRVVELARRRRRLVQADKVAGIFPRLADDAGIIVVFWHLVPGDYSLRLQGLKLVERGDPLKPALPVGLAEKGMNSIVDGIATNDQPDRRDLKAG